MRKLKKGRKFHKLKNNLHRQIMSFQLEKIII